LEEPTTESLKKDKQDKNKTQSNKGAKIKSIFDDRDKEIKKKFKDFRRTLSEGLHYAVCVESWSCDYTFGLNSKFNPLRPRDDISFLYDEAYDEYRTLIIKGSFLKPDNLKGQKIEASFVPREYLNKAKRDEKLRLYEESPPTSVGSLQTETNHIWGIISLPEDALGILLQTALADKIKFITFHGEKLRYGRGSIHRYFLQEQYDDEE
jgi:hypothetical protein